MTTGRLGGPFSFGCMPNRGTNVITARFAPARGISGWYPESADPARHPPGRVQAPVYQPIPLCAGPGAGIAPSAGRCGTTVAL